MIKGKITIIDRDSISQSEDILLQESSTKADPAQKEILPALLAIYLKQELKEIQNLDSISRGKDLQFTRACHIF